MDSLRRQIANSVSVVVFLGIDKANEKFSLGIKQLESDPFESAMAKLRKGEVVTAQVKQVTEGGLEVELNDGVLGFIRKSDLSRDRADQRPERFAVGDRLDAQVTNVDKAARRISLLQRKTGKHGAALGKTTGKDARQAKPSLVAALGLDGVMPT
mgnify:CR=1 FL=1